MDTGAIELKKLIGIKNTSETAVGPRRKSTKKGLEKKRGREGNKKEGKKDDQKKNQEKPNKLLSVPRGKELLKGPLKRNELSELTYKYMSLVEFWFDIRNYYYEEKFIDLKKFLFIYLHGSKELEKIPSIRFWAICIIYTASGMKILTGDGTVWTIEGIFEELNELLEKKKEKP